ncbi:MAG: GH25 family lysozyme, partial [Acidobacteriota bacterium]
MCIVRRTLPGRSRAAPARRAGAGVCASIAILLLALGCAPPAPVASSARADDRPPAARQPADAPAAPAVDAPAPPIVDAAPAHDRAPLAGIDVSHFQGAVDWSRVAADGVHFAFVKASGGLDVVDPTFAAHWPALRRAGVVRGAYHFFYPNDDAAVQARHFLDQLGPLEDDDLPPALDVEITKDVDGAMLRAGVLRWLEMVEAATGRRPILYTSPHFADAHLDDPRFADYPLWLADYNDAVAVPAAWQRAGHSWTFLQHQEDGQIDGVEKSVDLDRFAGDRAALDAFIRASRVGPGGGARRAARARAARGQLDQAGAVPEDRPG